MSKFTALAAALTIGLCSPAAAEVVATGDNSFVTQDSATVVAAPRQAWLALIRPGEWWNDNHTWSADASNMTLVPSAGGCFCETIPGDGDIPLDGSVQHAVVVQAVPDRALRMRGELGPLQAIPATGVLTITLTEIEDGTRIDWEYQVGNVTGFDIGVIAGAVDGVMSEQLGGLRDKLGALDSEEDDAPEDDVDTEDSDDDDSGEAASDDA